jgi:hypothetical protein
MRRPIVVGIGRFSRSLIKRSPEGGPEQLFVQFVVLSQLGDDRIRHDLASMDLGRLVTVNRGVPPDLRIAVNRDTKIASSYALLDDFFQFSRGFLHLIHVDFASLISQLETEPYRQE